LIYLIVIYFIVAFIKKYHIELVNNIRKNFLIFITSTISILFIIISVNYLGFKFAFFENKLMYFAVNNSPFVLLNGISLFCLFKRINIKNSIVNYLSSLSLLVYLIHINHIVMKYLLSSIMLYILKTYNTDYIVILVIIFSIILFIISYFIAIIYNFLFKKALKKFTDIIYNLFMQIYNNINI
jgi:hypothetical protein